MQCPDDRPKDTTITVIKLTLCYFIIYTIKTQLTIIYLHIINLFVIVIVLFLLFAKEKASQFSYAKLN